MFPDSFGSPALSSAILYFVSGFCVLLVVFVAIIAFSVMVSLTIVSAVHVFSETLRSQQGGGDVESGGLSAPAPSASSSARSSQQVLEVLNRIIRELGERQARHEIMLREAMDRLPPTVRHGGDHGEGEKECVICLDEFEPDDLCQAFPTCNHVFHSDCIGIWLNTNSTCPLCRTCILESLDTHKS